MPAPISHPAPDRLAAYGSGCLAPEDALLVEEHLGECEACGARLDEFFPDPFASALRHAASIESECSVHAPTVAFASDSTATDLDTIPTELAAHPRYRLGELLGRGGMGAVYKAEHTLMERPVAVKVIAPQLLRHPGAIERFKQEVKAAAKLHHPNIVTAFDAEEIGSVVVLVMEFVEGRSLADMLHERGPLPVRDACGYALQAARGIAHAHSLGMVHRDVKPHNLMLTADGCVKILDFGLARFVSEGLADAGTEETTPPDAPTEGLTSTGAVMGTLDYMAPEQARDAHSADARADVYALGCTLYHLLTGQVPFPGETALEKLARLTSDEPPTLTKLRPDVPPELAALVGKMMAKRPEDRTATATEAAKLLAPFACEPEPARRSFRKWWAALAAAMMLIAGAVVANAVIKIPTERGEVVIETDDAEIEVVVKGDRIVRIRDPKTGREYTLDRKNLTLGETDGDGLQVTLDGTRPVILKRNGTTIATVRLAVPETPFKPFVGHTDLCRGAVFGPDGTLYTCSDDGTARAWNPAGREVSRFDHGDVVRALALGEGGKTLLTAGEFGLRSWDAATGKLLGAFPAIPRGEIVNGLAVDPEGKLAATVSVNGVVRVWDVVGRKAVRDWKTGSGRAVWVIAWSPDGEAIVTSGDDGIVTFWNPATGTMTSRYNLATPVSSLSFAPDGKRLFVGCFTVGVRVVDRASGAVTTLHAERGAEPVRLAAASGGRVVVGRTRRVEVWGPDGTVLGEAARTPREVTWVAVSPDGSRTAAVGYDGTVTVAALTPDALRPLPTSPPGRTPPLPELTEVWQSKDQRSPRALAVSPDGKWAFSSGYDNTARRWDLIQRRESGRFGNGTETFDSLALSADGKRLLLAHQKSVARLWDVDSEKELQCFKGHTSTVACVALSPDSKRALTGAHDNTVRLWDTGTGAELKTLKGHTGPVRAVAFLSGNRAVSGGHDKTVRVWNLDTGETVKQFGPFDNYVLGLAATLDGKRVAVNAGAAGALFDLETGGSLWFKGHTDKLHAVAISPDGKLLATGGYDKTVRVWELDTGRCIAVGRGHTDYVVSVAFVGNAQVLSAGDHTIRMWELPRPVAPAPHPVTAKPIPAELDLIPRDSAGFVTVPVNELMTTPSLAWARQQVFAGSDFAEMVKATTRLDLHGVTRATVVWPTAEHLGGNILAIPPEVPSRVLVLTSSKSIRDRYADYLKPFLRAQQDTEEYRGRRYVLDADGWTALFLANDHTLVVGSRASVRLVIDRLADPKPGPLDGAVRTAADRPDSVVIGAQGAKGTGRALAAQLPQVFDALAPAFTADRVTIAASCRDGTRLEYRGEFASEDNAKQAEVSLGKACASGASGLDELLAEYDRSTFVDGRDAERKRERDFFVQTRDALRAAKPERVATTLRLVVRTESTYGFANVLPAVPYVLMPFGPMAMDRDDSEAQGRDQVIARALMAFHAKHGHFPPPAILDKDGKPLLSWQVAILPHLGDEAAALYKEFKLDEPWDSPANRKLLDRMPAALSTSPFKSTYRPRPNSGYRVYTAKGSVFEGPGGCSKTDITDELANTILAVRHRDEAPWTKPSALTFDNLEVVPHAAIFADSTTRPLCCDEAPDTIKALVTRSGGERVAPKEPGKRSAPTRQPGPDR